MIWLVHTFAHRFKKYLKVLLVFPQRVFRLFALGDVMHDGIEQGFSHERQGTAVNLHVADCAVLPGGV